MSRDLRRSKAHDTATLKLMPRFAFDQLMSTIAPHAGTGTRLRLTSWNGYEVTGVITRWTRREDVLCLDGTLMTGEYDGTYVLVEVAGETGRYTKLADAGPARRACALHGGAFKAQHHSSRFRCGHGCDAYRPEWPREHGWALEGATVYAVEDRTGRAVHVGDYITDPVDSAEGYLKVTAITPDEHGGSITTEGRWPQDGTPKIGCAAASRYRLTVVDAGAR